MISCTKYGRTIDSIVIEELKIPKTSIRAIHPIDEKTLFYAGSNGQIGITHDGGKTWETKTIRYNDSIKPHFRSIAYTGTEILALSVGNPALLYAYNPTKNDAKLLYKEEHQNVFYDCMKWDKNFGIAVGDPIDNKMSILINRNRKWIKQKNVPEMNTGEAFFAASNTNIKMIDNCIWIASGGKKARIFKSTDKGKTWKIYKIPFVQGKASQGIYSIDFYDKNNGFAIGGDYVNSKANVNNKAITNDGGKTWKMVGNNKNPNYKSCVKYVPNSNAKELFAVGKTGISYSNDGGKTWKDISKEAYYSIYFVNKNFAWLSGNNKIGKLNLK